MRPAALLPARRVVAARAIGVVLVLTVFASAGAAAHDTWLLPASMRVPVGRTVVVSLTSGMAFPVDDFAIDPSRVQRAVVRLAGATTPLARPAHAEHALRFRWRPARAGVAALAVELAPRTLTLPPALIGEYLDEIDASPAVRASWAAMPAPKQWRERYVKHAASYVRAGQPAADSSWAAPMGLGLELVPLADPTGLVAGDSLRIRVLRAGRPHAGLSIAARPEGQGVARQVTTDAEGRATIALPTAGRWMLSGTDLRRSSAAGLEWESDFVTLTLGVGRPERRDGQP